MPGRLTFGRVTIANGASLSSEIDLRSARLVAIQMPASWTAAAVTFQARPGMSETSPTGNDALQDVMDTDGAELTITATAADYLVPTGAEKEALDAMAVCKIRSGVSGAAVNQGAAREIIVVLEHR